MSNKIKYKKCFYYPAGLISLIMLPIICVWYLNKANAFNKSHVIELLWWSEDRKDQQFELYPDRKYTDIQLTNDDIYNKLKLDSSQFEVRKLLATNDTIKGVHFIFDSDSKYWALIRAIDICNIEKVNFIIKDNDMWVCNYSPRPLILMDCLVNLPPSGSMQCVTDFNFDKHTDSAQAENIKYIIETVKKYFVSILLFVVLLFFGIKQICNNYKAISAN